MLAQLLKPCGWLIGLLATVLLSASSVHAETISFSANFGPSPTNFATAVNISQFNPSLGALQSVTVTIEGTIGSTLIGTATGPGSINVSGTLSASAPGVVVVANPSINFPFVLGPVFGIGSDTDTTSGAGPLGPYIGVGTVAVNIVASAPNDAAVIGSNFSGIVFTNGAGTITITYQFFPGPEPGSLIVWAVVGMAGGGGVWLRRRRLKPGSDTSPPGLLVHPVT